jgi:hypothetical protein
MSSPSNPLPAGQAHVTRCRIRGESGALAAIHCTNAVLFALVIALHDVARRREASNMANTANSRRTTP